MVDATFKVVGSIAPQWSWAFSRWGEGVDDFGPVFKEIAQNFREGEQALFASEGATGGHGGWAALKPKYAAWKAKKMPGAKILEFSGSMRNASADPSVYITPTRLTMVIDDPKAIYHQRGTEFMPVRMVVDLSDKQKQEWGKAFHRHLFENRTGPRTNWGGAIQ